MRNEDIAIQINNLSKQYYRGVLNESSIQNSFHDFWQRLKQGNLLKKANKEPFWAIKNIQLTVKKGEILGVIGNNGAGKSTLLKLLAEVTFPTTGTIEIFGRLAPMLEIGAGFHGDLSGRDNIYLNGAILGMTRQEIKENITNILEFSGLTSFIESPLKHYSSGMQVRLAFAIAAFLQPEILLVDEVLAVGDVSFQRKCLAKMEEKAKEGITILFVSHDLEAVRRLCTRCVYLKKGKIELLGAPSEIIEAYLTDQQSAIQSGFQYNCLDSEDAIFISKAQLVSKRSEYLLSEEIPLAISFKTNHPPTFPIQLWMDVFNADGKKIIKSAINFNQNNLGTGQTIDTFLTIPPYLLLPGRYSSQFSIWMPHNWEKIFQTKKILPLKIVSELEKQEEYLKEASIVDCNWKVIVKY